MLQTQKTSTNVESKEDDIEVEQSIGNHVEDGCFLALLLPPNTLRGLELLVMLTLKSICRTRTHQKMLWQYGMMRFGTALGGSLNISESKNRLLQLFENNFKIKESSVLVFSKTSTGLMFSWKNRKRTGDSLAGSLTFLYQNLRTGVIGKNLNSHLFWLNSHPGRACRVLRACRSAAFLDHDAKKGCEFNQKKVWI